MNASDNNLRLTWARSALRRVQGFTLVELVLAMGVVAVLVLVALPMFNGWRDKVKIKKATEDVQAMSVVIEAFHQDVGRFPASLAEIKRDSLRDPWGNPYAYLDLTTVNGNGQARKDHSLVPLNTDFDLYSSGPDGTSASALTAKASRDDIIRANNGRYIGPANNY